MSLSVLLKDSFGQELRWRLLDDFPTPKFNMGAELKASPAMDYAISGTAFDYLLRFAIEHRTKKEIIVRSTSMAERAATSLLDMLGKKKCLKIMASHGNTVYVIKDLISCITEEYNDVKKHIKKFLRNGNVDHDVLHSCVFLAKLDLYARRRIIHGGFMKSEPEIINDLRALYDLVEFEKFNVQKKCYLNPWIGMGSFIGGSEADLIIDDTLIEIKTTKRPKLQRADFNQIISYYMLSLISGINGETKERPIKKLGIYFARFGVLWTIPVNKLGDKKKFEDLKNWFLKYPPHVTLNEQHYLNIERMVLNG